MAEMPILASLAAALSPLMSGGVLVWLIQRGFAKQDEAAKSQGEDIKSIKGRMDCFESARHACQIENAKYFATKEEVSRVKEDVDRFSMKVEEHGEDIAALKVQAGMK